jgi:hypothetical protein
LETKIKFVIPLVVIFLVVKENVHYGKEVRRQESENRIKDFLLTAKYAKDLYFTNKAQMYKITPHPIPLPKGEMGTCNM